MRASSCGEGRREAGCWCKKGAVAGQPWHGSCPRTARSQRQSQSGLHHGSGTYSSSTLGGGGVYGGFGFSRGKPHLLPLVTCFS